jgi:hypothetical protein
MPSSVPIPFAARPVRTSPLAIDVARSDITGSSGFATCATLLPPLAADIAKVP